MSGNNVVWKGNTEIDVVKKDSLMVMEHHANKQIDNLREQAKLLIKQARDIKNRVELSHIIAQAKYGFKPVHLKTYYLYKNDARGTGDEELTLTLIAPNEWTNNRIPYGEFVTAVRQLGDSTWEKVNEDVQN